MKVLFFGDIVGEPGLRALERELPALQERLRPDFVLANGENLDLTRPEAGKAGMTLPSLERLFRLGVDAVTGGNHSFDPEDLEEVLAHPRVLRPLNYSPYAPGRGSLLLRKGGHRLLVVNLAGRSALPHAGDPLEALEAVLDREEGWDAVLVDFHSESVFEKMGTAFAFDGRISALLGTHTHVATADARILPRGTGYVSDVGMVGADGGMQGYDPAFLVEAFRRRLPPRGMRLGYAEGPLRLSYVFLELRGNRAESLIHVSELLP
ncbi:metallophosphoesterase (plasmid) [Thermus thermophilus]|uniref:TIGR00282 family metallophosphoesterase n=1 Tax=Thermus thermophilus TaxID=274 RepID=UPI001FCD3CE0|nr:TIGR00282 family metallophosphoesterase [Thermus thermophilus]BDG20173.1 metallophosphoesterase [Thermus thermophilus]